jgi:hypothetical protein
VRLATLYVLISTTRAALNTRQKGTKATGFLKFLKADKTGAYALKKLRELVEEGELGGRSAS